MTEGWAAVIFGLVILLILAVLAILTLCGEVSNWKEQSASYEKRFHDAMKELQVTKANHRDRLQQIAEIVAEELEETDDPPAD